MSENLALGLSCGLVFLIICWLLLSQLRHRSVKQKEADVNAITHSKRRSPRPPA